jgi:hypothetical protein
MLGIYPTKHFAERLVAQNITRKLKTEILVMATRICKATNYIAVKICTKNKRK